MPNASRYLEAGYTYHLTHRCHDRRCLRYVSLNMVRAGAVTHPDEWRWCGHDEITGSRQRYTILAVDRLLQSLEMPSVEALRKAYGSSIEDAIARRQLARAAAWTEAVAVGDRAFVERAAESARCRSRFEYEFIDDESWAVREDRVAYSPIPHGRIVR